LEHWAFFLRNAEQLDPETIRRLLPEPEFEEALGVLEMITRTPEQQLLYNSRLKFQRDETARLEYAKEQGRSEGRTEGRLEGEQVGQIRGEQIGRIRVLEQMLSLPPSSSDELAKLSSVELAAKADDLQRQLGARLG